MTVLTNLRKNYQTYVEWSIEKFFDLPKNVDYFLESDPFSISDGKWCLRIYPNGRNDANTTGSIDLNIRRLDSGEKTNEDFETGFKKIDGQRYETFKYFSKSDENTALYGWYGFGRSEGVSKLKHYLGKGGTVTVFCIARIGDSIKVPPKEASGDGEDTLKENYRNMFYNRYFTDVTVSVRGSSKPAHKSVLSARSYHLNSLFSSNENMNHVELCDCNSDVFESFIQFLYTGDSSLVTSYNAMSLYKAAIKYEVTDLREKCIQCMEEQPLDVEMFCDVFLSAAMGGDAEKKDAATDFFFDNAKEIISSSKWDSFAADHPSSSKELLYKFVEKGESKPDGKKSDE